MPLLRCSSQLPAPPPSPVPTAKGSRNAANEPLRHFLDSATQGLPELTLPDAHMPAAMRNPALPSVIDYQKLKQGTMDTVLRRSAKAFGAFGICGHGISGQDLILMANEARHLFEDSDAQNHNDKRHRQKDTIPCVQSRKGTLEFTAPKFLDDHKHRKFWIQMGNAAGKLEGIVEQVIMALSEEELKGMKMEDMESVIWVCRYPQDDNESDENDTLWDHALRFYLPMEHCIFYVQSQRGPLSFDAAPHTIVVTLGKQLEEWSEGRLKCVHGEMIFMPSRMEQCDASFSIEIKCSSSNLKYKSHPHHKSGPLITLLDQLLFLLCLSFLYQFSHFIF
ncbi:hypothetical protein QN277_025102 [Acacia crassicarpa]|uniref:Non-haem dioxygenase N-terminal domain-containing protein n=1 Tax=Acacia crassicarpa TaxID=499986 RepID=A0AAE1KAI4_9FABA|nr:hypothetical protein QN277_025102 [Acacia crassicarpa]